MPVFVNNVEITDDQVFAEMQYHPAASATEAQERAALALTIKELLCQEARRIGIVPPNNNDDPNLIDDYLVNTLLEQQVATPSPTDEECDRYYQRNPSIFRDNAGNPVPFAAVKDSIAEYLSECSEQKATEQYIKILVGNAKIAGIHIEGTDSPLVQ
jgi:peptidyl-prolyl cis-trans isomerase C